MAHNEGEAEWERERNMQARGYGESREYQELQHWKMRAERAELALRQLESVPEYATFSHDPIIGSFVGMQGIDIEFARQIFRMRDNPVHVFVGRRVVFTNMAQFLDWQKERK